MGKDFALPTARIRALWRFCISAGKFSSVHLAGQARRVLRATHTVRSRSPIWWDWRSPAADAAMFTGIFARIGALCIAMVMVGTIQMVHLKNGFDIGLGGKEYALSS